MELTGGGTVGGAVLEWGAVSDVGNHRSLNEDAMLIEPPLFVVADGMGGHDAGEVASGLTTERLRTLGGDEPIAIDAISQELHNINSLLRNATPAGSDTMMGTTSVGLVVVDNGGVISWLVFNVGDSRAYSLADGVLSQVSRDHSFVQELVDAAEIDESAARVHPHRNVVTRALGADAEVRPDYWVRPLRPRERFLLCSDGLTGEIEDGVIATVLGTELSAQETAETLVGLALEAGGRDNITVVVVDVVSVPTWDDSSTERNSMKLRALRSAVGLTPATDVGAMAPPSGAVAVLDDDAIGAPPPAPLDVDEDGGTPDAPAEVVGAVAGLIEAVPTSARSDDPLEPVDEAAVVPQITAVPRGPIAPEAEGADEDTHDGVSTPPPAHEVADVPRFVSPPAPPEAPPDAEEPADVEGLHRFRLGRRKRGR